MPGKKRRPPPKAVEDAVSPKENKPRGRPRSGRAATFTMRMEPELLAGIKRAAEAKHRSIAREMEFRLQASVDMSADRVDLRGLLGVVRELALGLERSYDTGRRWYDDPYTFDAFAAALGTLLENLRPKGEMKVPDRVKRDIDAANARDQHFLDAWIDPLQAGAAHAHILFPTLVGSSQVLDIGKVLRELAEFYNQPQRKKAA